MLKLRKTFTSCSDLPLYNFIKIVVTNDKNWLYSEHKMPWLKSADLESIWENIFNEYSELSNDKHGKAVFSITKTLTVLNGKIWVIEQCLSLLQSVSSVGDVKDYAETIQTLKSYGFNYEWLNITLDDDIRKTKSSMKRIVLERNDAQKSYENLQSDNSKQATEADFDILIGQLSKFQGYYIDKKVITVAEYISYIAAFNLANSPKNA